MEQVERFLQNNDLRDPEDFDALLALADLVRQLMAENRQEALGRVIRYTLERGCPEAFSWCLDLLQEGLEQPDSGLTGFEIPLGGAIPDFDGFLERLGADLRPCGLDTETILDTHGEVESFYNILIYKTAYPNILLVSAENFDTKDNDFIQYKLVSKS